MIETLKIVETSGAELGQAQPRLGLGLNDANGVKLRGKSATQNS